MQDIHLTYNQILTYIVIANVVLALLMGIMPLIAGIKLNQTKVGVYGLIATIVGGAVLGLFLSFPMAAFFIWFICRKVNSGPVHESAENSPAH
jgi:uncharacterized membrane-anchored protein